CGVDCESCKDTKRICTNVCTTGFVWHKVYECYGRPCCSAHDACYDNCKDALWPALCRRRCDANALSQGCGLADANGNTRNEPDAYDTTFYHQTDEPCDPDATADGEVTAPRHAEDCTCDQCAAALVSSDEGDAGQDDAGGTDMCDGFGIDSSGGWV